MARTPFATANRRAARAEPPTRRNTITATVYSEYAGIHASCLLRGIEPKFWSRQIRTTGHDEDNDDCPPLWRFPFAITHTGALMLRSIPDGSATGVR
ncbi:hypothetical protein [Arthrobacter sp. AZCC_0090]|uniref:hypothetical protein n=1 Tax=Arthrobacter sp. AZCC_0090 TaxID=2735881 RepID=UPI001619BA07|nr:hypothetical protein [Arthrobacter sp. AZCC_0090]MBB6405508.1 hypothetical protein [Arthrobacter sp. AZCC_0090]